MDGSGQASTHADALQRGLISHCYRMLASITEALEVAESARGSYEFATRECLTRAGSRPLPTDLAAASDDPEGELHQRSEVLWLEPIPSDLADHHPIDLGYIAALQHVPAPQRAATLLHNLEGWPLNQVTDLLGPVELPPLHAPMPSVTDDALLARYREAFEQYDVPAIVTFFADDAVWEMPPFTSWFRGPRNIGRLISTHCPAKGPGDQLMVPIHANHQPAFAVYMRDPKDNVHRAFQIQVLALTAVGIVHAVAFFDLTLFQSFHLPELLTGLPPNLYDGTPRPHVERLPRH
ncbi:RNA polymerase subunit sigma-70 [Kribbella capetownensis]|uniref:RNA polymerase subunit sigma-70 n=1 Tax=Kribbella capetownensis TaxID=1572659 RepID=A0A4R0JEU4_9ACTN|nr:nuclear transport factor 2 family protein [Kribbella capetownensis]TCC44094.1 RNA polymerase subunit sigma-70 [Kribbella capetownensis]